jgi:hypothetical protein
MRKARLTCCALLAVSNPAFAASTLEETLGAERRQSITRENLTQMAQRYQAPVYSQPVQRQQPVYQAPPPPQPIYRAPAYQAPPPQPVYRTPVVAAPPPAPKPQPPYQAPVRQVATPQAPQATSPQRIVVPQPTATVAPTVTPARPTYTYAPTNSGTVQVFQNGQLISTTTPQFAAQQFGYKGNIPTPAPTVTPAAITSGKITTPSGAVVDAATGQLISAPPTALNNPASLPTTNKSNTVSSFGSSNRNLTSSSLPSSGSGIANTTPMVGGNQVIPASRTPNQLSPQNSQTSGVNLGANGVNGRGQGATASTSMNNTGTTFQPLKQTNDSLYSASFKNQTGAKFTTYEKEACKATVYTMIARTLPGNNSATIDKYMDAKGNAVWQGSLQNKYTLASPQSMNGQNVKALIDKGHPVIIDGTVNMLNSGGKTEPHAMLATSYLTDPKTGAVTALKANDPWTGKPVTIDIKTGAVTDPDYPLQSFRASAYQDVAPR